MVDINVKIDVKNLEKKVSPQAIARGKLAMTNQMLLDMERFVPKRSGELRTTAKSTKDSVIYTAPYARIRFYNRRLKLFFSDKQRRFFFANKDKLLKQRRTPGTGPRWDLKAKAKYGKKWGKVALDAMGIK